MELEKQFVFKALDSFDQVPYHLLLLADPSRELIDAYLSKADIFVVRIQDETKGVIVMTNPKEGVLEIKNIAVSTESQGYGIGSFMIEKSFQIAKKKDMKIVRIGTANSSLKQLALYQRLGFRVNEIQRNFFLDNYRDPIFEDGIQATDMLILQKEV